MSFYSSNGVDALVAKILPDFGYACDVGASDGKFQSNTLHFEERGWLVLCVEPNPSLEPSGKECRKLWRQVACGAEDLEEHEFVTWGAYPFASNSSLGFKRQPPSQFIGKTHQVKVRRLDRVLEEAGFPRLDYLSIDVEGWEMEVLQGFSLERWAPKVVVIEDIYMKYPLLEGYEDHGVHEFDRVFVRKQ